MKLIHMSDLHLGKRVNEFSMIEDQKYILKEILTIINSEKPDGILIAGDVYDRSIPSEDAIMLWDEFLVSLVKKNIPVYAISGNHDSAVRFSDHSTLVEASGVFLAPEYNGNANCHKLKAGDTEVNIYLLPFIKPAVVKHLFEDEEISSYTDACRVAVGHMNVDDSKINILVAHQFVTGAARCDSEEVSVGGLDNVDASVFDPFDYVALGHIHGKQKIGRDTLRYCGTPLKYSFSEKDHVKSLTVIEISGKEKIDIREIPLKPLHDLRQIRGTYEELMLKKNYENTATEDYIHAVLTDENDVLDAMARMRIVYSNIMQLTYDNKRTRSNRTIEDLKTVEDKAPIDLFGEFYEQQNNQPMTDEQREFVMDCIESIWKA